MAKYKLTTVATYSDNEEPVAPQENQKYADMFADDWIDNWDTADVTLEVNDGEIFKAHREGNRFKGEGISRLANFPWHKASEERPDTKKDIKLLGWFDTGSTAYDFDVIKYRVKDGEFCDRNGYPLMTDHLWWRTLEKPELNAKKED